MKLTIELPFVRWMEDWHQVRETVSLLEDLTGRKVKSKEFDRNGLYYAAFYAGKAPTEKQIKEILDAHDLI
jgi:hypothetical protein